MPHHSAVMAELGGHHHQDRKLYDTPTIPRNSDQRAAVKSAQKTGCPSKDLTAEAASNHGDEEEGDSSAAQEDEEDEDGGEAQAMAVSYGHGKGKGKGPAIRVEPVDEDFEDEGNDAVSDETAFKPGMHSASLMGNKKRTFSTLSNTSLLFGDDEAEKSFPRRKVARKLSSDNFKPLLKYKQNTDATMTASEHAIESDDEDYSGVNLVPDDDDFEEEEESFIIQDELGHNNAYSSFASQYNDSRRLSLDSHASDSIFDMTAPLEGPYTEGISLPDHGFGQFFEPEAVPTSPDVGAKRKYSDSSTKRVRFDDQVEMSDSSSSSSSDLDSSLYPDLFLEQDKLPASLSQLLDNDYDEDNGDYDSPESEMSFWEYQDSAPRPSTAGEAALEDDESSGPGSSGYETDMGDTTDEYESDLESDAQAPQTPLQKKSVLHRPSSAPGSKVSSPQPFERSRPAAGRAKPPVRGIFVHEDNSKAIAITNRTTKRLTFYRPRASVVTWMTSHNPYSSSNSTNNSPRTSLQQFNGSDSEISNDVLNNQFTSDIMLSGIFGGAPNNNNSSNDFMFGAENMGPPEAFFPFVSIGANGTVIEDEADNDEDDDEDDLNLAEFMDFGEGADDTDVEQEEEETDVPATPATSMVAINGSTPAHPTPRGETPANRKRNASDAMLQHFDRGVVTAFRNNQNRYRDVACLPSDPTIRASVSKPIRSGKSAETVMTPVRKSRAGPKRPAKSPFQKHASSPLSGVSKASGRLHNSVLNTHPPRMGTFS